MKPRRYGLLIATAVAAALGATAAAADWMPTRWNGESAYELTTENWRAIVSIERGRLVHFGPADEATNVVFAPATRMTPVGWGGHRVWLGPQDRWSRFWPPPTAWEQSAAAHVSAAGSNLVLTMPDAGEGWPRLTRVYALVDGQLACRIEVGADGTRDVQVMQILQTRPSDDLTVPIIASPEAPLGCLLLPPFQGRRAIEPMLEPLDYMAREDDALRIRPAPRLDKIAFPPQPLVARYGGHVLRVDRGESRGAEVGAPDRGFYTQVCPGQEGTPVVELEQLSPLYRAGEAAAFTMLLDLRAAE